MTPAWLRARHARIICESAHNVVAVVPANFLRRISSCDETFMKNFLAQREFTPNFLIRPKNFFEHRVPRPQIVHGSDMTKGRTVTKLALTAAMTAAILSSGLAMSANAQENHYMSGQQVIGEKGAR